MTKFLTNPSEEITEDGEYESSSEYRPGSTVRMEVYGTRGSADIQPGVKDPAGNFAPALPAVTDDAEPTLWTLDLCQSGIPAIKVTNATGATSLRLATTPASA